MAKSQSKKKKKTKVDPEGIAFIKSTFNNTIITLTDKYGNAMTGISRHAAKPIFNLKVNDCSIGHANTFSDVSIAQPFWYVNSNGLVEIAVNQGSAAEHFGLVIGSKINIGEDGET